MASDNPAPPEVPAEKLHAENLPAEFYVLKHGEMFGPFREEQLQEGLKDGHFAPEDFVQIDGKEDWHALGRVLGMEESDLRGAVAPDWNSILKWAWFRLRYNIGEQSLEAGCACLGIGTLALAFSRWPFVFWLPWFGATVACAIPLLRRKRETHGALLLVGVVCIPFLFIIFGQKNRARESQDAAVIPGISATPQEVPENRPLPLSATPAENPETPGGAILSAPPSPASQPPPAESTPGPVQSEPIPEPVTPHYGPVPAESVPPVNAPPAVTPPKPAVEKSLSPAPKPTGEVDFVHDHEDALVLVKGTEGSGSGFICKAGNGATLFTNTHVIADITDPTVTGMDGAIVSPGLAEVAAGRDIARFALSQAPAHPLEVISDFDNKVRIGDAVVVLGNSGGGGVVTKIEGKIVGIGPDRIEVSAEFIPGNSGSPIIHVKTGQVIGIATYLTKRYEEFSSNNSASATPAPGSDQKPMGAVVVRRFGYRIDNAAAWERVEWNDFRSEAAEMRQISTLTGDIFDFLGSLRAKQEPNFKTETLRRPATEWLASLKTKRVSDADRQDSTRGFLNSLRTMVRSDVTAAEMRMRYTYFREELKDESRIRDLLYKAFDEQSSKLSEPNSHPKPTKKSR